MNLKLIKTLGLLGLITLNSASLACDANLAAKETPTSQVPADANSQSRLASIGAAISANYDSIFGTACVANGIKRFFEFKKTSGFTCLKNFALSTTSLAAATLIFAKICNCNDLHKLVGPAVVYGTQTIAATDILLNRISNPAFRKINCSVCGSPCKCPAQETWSHKIETIARCAIALPALVILANKFAQTL